MERILELCFGFIGVGEEILMLFFSGRITGARPRLRDYALYIFLCQGVSWGGAEVESFALTGISSVLILYGVHRLLFRSSSLTSAAAAILSTALMQLSYGTVNTLLSMIMPYIKPGASFGWIPGVTAALVSLLLFYGFGIFLAKNFTLEGDLSDRYLVILLAPLVFLWAIGFYVINRVYGNVVTVPYPIDPAKYIELLFMMILGFGTTLSSLYAYKGLRNSLQERSRLAMLEQEAHAQRIYVKEAQMRYEQTASFRHDIKNHFVVLDGLLKAGASEEALDYLEKLRSVTEELSLYAYTGNGVVDVLLSSKLELAGQRGIQTELLLKLPSGLGIDDLDLCIIFSNALDNAIAACSQVEGERTISIQGEGQGDFYFMEFKNSCRRDMPAQVPFGTGLNNIKAVAEKYGGAVTAEQRNAEFCLAVLLNIS